MSTSSISSDAPLVQLLSNTARWVSKLKREPEEVARVLHAIGHTHPDALSALESHFQSFCIMQGRDLPTIQRLWTATPLSDDDDDPLDVLRGMYWADNPEDCLLETRSYDDVKRQIEMDWGYWKCAHPVGYVRVEPKTGEICILSQNKMRDLLLDVHYAQPSQTSRVENVPIGPRWLADENKRRYTRIVVDPTMRHDPAEFNMWVGFAAEKLPPVAVDEVPALVQPLLDHIRDVLAAGNVDHCRYIVDWMSFLVQKPERRTQTLLLFHGQQGTGKGIIWDFVRDHVLGPHACTQTANAKNDLFDRFSNGFLHKRLVQLDEAQDIRQYEDDLKNKVTAKDLRYEKKNQDTITVTNFANFVVTTNNLVTLRVASDDRRLVLFSCADTHRGDRAYFERLCHHLQHRPGVARAVYQFFMARDLSEYTSDMAFQDKRPMTDFYKDTRSDSLKPEYLFFSALFNYFSADYPSIRISAADLYVAYKTFLVDGFATEQKPMHHTTFGRFVNKMSAAVLENSTIPKGHHKAYTLHLQLLRKFLVKHNSYDAESMLTTKPNHLRT